MTSCLQLICPCRRPGRTLQCRQLHHDVWVLVINCIIHCWTLMQQYQRIVHCRQSSASVSYVLYIYYVNKKMNELTRQQTEDTSEWNTSKGADSSHVCPSAHRQCLDLCKWKQAPSPCCLPTGLNQCGKCTTLLPLMHFSPGPLCTVTSIFCFTSTENLKSAKQLNIILLSWSTPVIFEVCRDFVAVSFGKVWRDDVPTQQTTDIWLSYNPSGDWSILFPAEIWIFKFHRQLYLINLHNLIFDIKPYYHSCFHY